MAYARVSQTREEQKIRFLLIFSHRDLGSFLSDFFRHLNVIYFIVDIISCTGDQRFEKKIIVKHRTLARSKRIKKFVKSISLNVRILSRESLKRFFVRASYLSVCGSNVKTLQMLKDLSMYLIVVSSRHLKNND